MIRVLVVDDSPTVRARLVEILEAAPGVEVVGQAGDGKRAIELAAALRPDVITLDLALPEVNGLAVTEHVMAHQPTPILIVSASFNRGELFDTYQALAAGAVDVLDKPGPDDDAWESRFLSTIRLISKIKVITHPRGRLGAFGRTASPTLAPETASKPARRPEVIVLGASTGGPGALVDVIQGIPLQAPPIIVVLHIGPAFAVTFADWLATQTHRRVRIAADGDRVDAAAGEVLFAGPLHHIAVEGRRVKLIDAPPRHHCRPSIDTLFEAVASTYRDRAAAALLTGMGRDGASGLLAIRLAGGTTFAQDEATSVVYGMPREAVMCGGADHVLPLGEIGPALARLVRSDR